MGRWKRATVIAVCSVGLVCSAITSDSDAGWVRRWLARRWIAGRGLFMRHHRLGPEAVPVAQPCAQPSPQPAIQYVPQTSYRTEWSCVPVTTYRPVTVTDPRSCCPVTCMRPCTTYQWQARRVPYTTFRAVCATLAPTQVLGAPAAGCSTCGPTTSVVPSAQSVPPPATTLGPVETTPVPIQQPPYGNSPVPADQIPTLAPGQVNPGAFSNPPSLNNSYRLPQTSERQNPATVPDLQPVPDLDRPRSHQDTGPAPPLLDPRERTAARPIYLAGDSSPIRWAVRAAARDIQPASEAPSPNTWDDSGWQTAGR